MALWKVQLGDDALRLPKAPTTLAQAGVKSLYSINGPIRLLSIHGIVTTAIQAQANGTKLQFKPTGQTAIDLCAVGDITGLAVGQLVGMTGIAANALAFGWGIVGQTTPWMLSAGTLDMNCVASSSGAIEWILRYLPLRPNAAVAAL
jgi:hypothetical protein